MAVEYYLSNEMLTHHTSIGGLVVKLAVAISKIPGSKNDSASPGFDSRPMHHKVYSDLYGNLSRQGRVCSTTLLFLVSGRSKHLVLLAH